MSYGGLFFRMAAYGQLAMDQGAHSRNKMNALFRSKRLLREPTP